MADRRHLSYLSFVIRPDDEDLASRPAVSCFLNGAATFERRNDNALRSNHQDEEEHIEASQETTTCVSVTAPTTEAESAVKSSSIESIFEIEKLNDPVQLRNHLGDFSDSDESLDKFNMSKRAKRETLHTTSQKSSDESD